jgi:hypothetical protein
MRTLTCRTRSGCLWRYGLIVDDTSTGCKSLPYTGSGRRDIHLMPAVDYTQWDSTAADTSASFVHSAAGGGNGLPYTPALTIPRKGQC